MATKQTRRFDSRAIEKALKERVIRSGVERMAEAIADQVRIQGHRVEGIPGDIELPVEVRVYDTDRARASVMLAHPSGIAIQAKNGVLTRAASAVGVETNG